MKNSDIIDDLRHYMGTEELLIKVGDKLYRAKEMSFSNINGRPVLVAGHEVTLTRKDMYDWVYPQQLDVGDMIEGGDGKWTVVSKDGYCVMLHRPVIVVDEMGNYHTEIVQFGYPLDSLQKQKFIGRTPSSKEELQNIS